MRPEAYEGSTTCTHGMVHGWDMNVPNMFCVMRYGRLSAEVRLAGALDAPPAPQQSDVESLVPNFAMYLAIGETDYHGFKKIKTTDKVGI